MDECSVYAPARESCLVQELGVRRGDEWDEEERGHMLLANWRATHSPQSIPQNGSPTCKLWHC